MPLGIQRLLLARRRRLRKERAAVRVLMVCTVNFCRSPMAEGMFGRLVEQAGLAEQIYVDSAGTHASLVGAAPDLRGQKALAKRGIDISTLRSRGVVRQDLDDFDYILAMDKKNHAFLLELCTTPEQRSRVNLIMHYAPDQAVSEVPDPYYGGTQGFERVLDLLEPATLGVLQHIRQHSRF